jgi:hypothetical protein
MNKERETALDELARCFMRAAVNKIIEDDQATMPTARSIERITVADLSRLAALAARDRKALFTRKPELAARHEGRLLAVALCQGAALHYLDGKTGVKDFDVWSFYRADAERPFPYRRRGVLDFGDAKFGQTTDSPQFIGRRVDLIGRSIKDDDYSDPIAVLRRYLRGGRSESARALSRKAVILIEPTPLLGAIVWPIQEHWRRQAIFTISRGRAPMCRKKSDNKFMQEDADCAMALLIQAKAYHASLLDAQRIAWWTGFLLAGATAMAASVGEPTSGMLRELLADGR